jgi:hypothetical protein
LLTKVELNICDFSRTRLTHRNSLTPEHVEPSRSLDCCNRLPLSAPQPAVDNRFELERAFKLTVWQQAARSKAAAGCSSPGHEA